MPGLLRYGSHPTPADKELLAVNELWAKQPCRAHAAQPAVVVCSRKSHRSPGALGLTLPMGLNALLRAGSGWARTLALQSPHVPNMSHDMGWVWAKGTVVEKAGYCMF